MPDVAIIGTGYVGLTTGAFLAHTGHNVVCADVDESKIERLSRGEMPIFEPGLDELVHEGLDNGRLRFVVGAATAAARAEFVFLCVQTPQGEDGSADLSYIEAAAREVSPVLRSSTVVINKSTVPVGSTIVVERALGRSDVKVVSNPEFLREGSAVHDCLHPDRIVIGSEDHGAAIRVASLYDSIKAPQLITDPASAETIKYASNAFLATKISFVNAVANMCEAVGADVREVVLGMGYDKRIGFEFLHPGPGWGGSCFHPEETLLVRRGAEVRLVTMGEMWDLVEEQGLAGWETLSWEEGDPRPEFRPVTAVTRRPWSGDLLRLTTEMGRRVLVTPDHPMLCSDGSEDVRVVQRLAGDVTEDDWLPVVQGFPLTEDPLTVGRPLDAVPAAGLTAHQVIVRVPPNASTALAQSAVALPPARRREVLRRRALRLHEAAALDLDLDACSFGTTANGTYVPGRIELDRAFWRVVGLWLSDGSAATDGRRNRLSWHFHPSSEEHLVEEVASYWRSLGVRALVQTTRTSSVVSVSSRILATWFCDVLGMGRGRQARRLPDVVWTAPEHAKRWLLSGLWHSDGDSSLVTDGPSGTLGSDALSPVLADGVLRLLGDVGIVARQALGGQAQPIETAGCRRLSKSAAWLRIVRTERVHHHGLVHSLEVFPTHTVVTTGGLVVHNCFPKDTQALVRIAEESGYDFDLLRGVIAVNDAQKARIVDKVVAAAGGSVADTVVAVWGLTFKARTDDRRSSPSIDIAGRLAALGATIRAYDPTVVDELPGIEVCGDPYSACEGATVIAVLTEWDEFRWVDFGKCRSVMVAGHLVDARNLLDPAAVRRKGFTYTGVGRV